MILLPMHRHPYSTALELFPIDKICRSFFELNPRIRRHFINENQMHLVQNLVARHCRLHLFWATPEVPQGQIAPVPQVQAVAKTVEFCSNSKPESDSDSTRNNRLESPAVVHRCLHLCGNCDLTFDKTLRCG